MQQKTKMDAFITTSRAAQQYECGYNCENAIVTSVGGELFFITDSRFTIEAKERVKKGTVVESSDLFRTARELARKNNGASFYIDPYEISFGEYKKITAYLPKNRFIPEKNFHQKKRAVKSESEIAKIHQSVEDNAKAFDTIAEFLGKNGWRRTEKDLHFTLKQFLQDYGRRDMSFDPIFAIESNAAKPHASPTERRLEYGDSILFDAGVKHDGYCSDRTRTAEYGESGIVDFSFDQKFANSKKQRIYDTVLSAHHKTIDSIKAGQKAKTIDAVARNHIREAGFGRFFSHSTGHGVGLEIHEEPYINKKSETVIENGMVFTIEPGIYIPGFFGARVESVVAIKDDRAVIL